MLAPGELVEPFSYDWPDHHIPQRIDLSSLTEHSLAAIRNTGRLLAETSPAAIGVLTNLTNYIIGCGFSYKIRPAPKDELSADLAGLVQQALDDILETTDFRGQLEREIFLRSRRDGECFAALFIDQRLQVRLRIIEPEQVAQPQSPRAVERALGISHPSDWTFGVHTPADDVEQVLGCHALYGGDDWRYMPASQVEHVKVNVDRSARRGVSDFYAVRRHLEDAEKLLRNMRQGAAVQSAIAFIREHAPGVTTSQITALASSQAEQKTTAPVAGGGSRTRYLHRYQPGTIIDVGRGQTYKPGPLGAVHGPNFLAIEQATLRMAGVRWCMPEHIISGDASNNNFASILEAGAPFARNSEAQQQVYARSFRRLLMKALRLAHASGRFSRLRGSWQNLSKHFDLVVEPPEVAARDRLDETKRRRELFEAGVLSPQTWAAKEGLDWERERANWERLESS